MNTWIRLFLPVLIAPLLLAAPARALVLPAALDSAAPVALGIVQVNAGSAAQTMVERLGEEAINTIADKDMSASAKKQTFSRLLTRNFDMATIGRFAMGRYWRVATPQQQAEYLRLFEKMVVDVYTARFDKYSGQSFDVTGNRVDDSGDIVVSSKVVAKGSPAVAVDWRVRPKAGGYRIIDVMVEGVSMAVTQRSDFASIIQKGGGTVDALLEYLRKGGTSDAGK